MPPTPTKPTLTVLRAGARNWLRASPASGALASSPSPATAAPNPAAAPILRKSLRLRVLLSSFMGPPVSSSGSLKDAEGEAAEELEPAEVDVGRQDRSGPGLDALIDEGADGGQPSDKAGRDRDHEPGRDLAAL